MAKIAAFSVAHVCLQRGYSSKHRQVELLVKSLSGLGIYQTLLCRDDSPMHKRLKGTPGLSILRISGLSDPRFSAHFKVMRKCKMIHAHDHHGANWAVVHYLMFGVPFIVTVREFKTFTDSFADRMIFSWASEVLATQNLIATAIANKYKVDVSIIPDSTSSLRAHEKNVKAIHDAFKGRYIIGCVGDLINRHYGQATLIDAMRQLSSKIPHAVVLFIGQGDDIGLLKKHANGLPNIKFLGPQKNLVDYIAAFNVFVYPVNIEANSSILLDVMDQKVPIIASDVEGIPELIVNGETGILIPPKDPEALANAILRLKNDQYLEDYIAGNAIKIAKQHEAPFMAKEYMIKYKDNLMKRD